MYLYIILIKLVNISYYIFIFYLFITHPMKSTTNNNVKNDSRSDLNTSSKSDTKSPESSKNQSGSKEGQSEEKKSSTSKSK